MQSIDSAVTSVKALSPDNDRIIKELISLFLRAHGEHHPNKNVYSAQYWRSHVGSRFASFAAFNSSRIIAHIAALPDRHNPATVQLVFPVIDPEFKNDEAIIVAALESALTRQAQRAAWKSVFNFDFVGCPTTATFEIPILGASDVAVAPNYFPRLENSGQAYAPEQSAPRLNIQVRQSLLNGTLSDDLTLYVPERHREMVQFLYEPFKLKRTFKSGTSMQVGSLSADYPALHDDYFAPVELRHIFVQPGLISQAQKTALFARDLASRARFIFVNMRDAACPSFCEELENSGFLFCGVMPNFFSRENIIYFQVDEFTLDPAFVQSERGRRLANYIEEQYKKSGSRIASTLTTREIVHAAVGRR